MVTRWKINDTSFFNGIHLTTLIELLPAASLKIIFLYAIPFVKAKSVNIIANLDSVVNLRYSKEKEEKAMKKWNLSLLIVLFALLLLVADYPVTAEEMPLVPDFALLTKDNETIRLSDYKGKIVVLNFWASWCPPCRAEMPDFQKLHDELEESGEAVLLLLNQIDGSRETLKTGTSYLEKNNFTMVNLFDHGLVGGGIFGIPGLPTTVVIDREGYLSSYVVGTTTKATVQKMIEGAK